MKKVLQLGKFYPIKGGVEKVMYDLMNGLSQRGVYCDMLCAVRDKSLKNKTLNKYAISFVATHGLKYLPQ